MSVRYTKRNNGRFTKTKARAQVTKTITDEDGEEWLSPLLAAKYLRISTTMLHRYWGKCPFLNGRGIETRQYPTAFGRMITYSKKKSLNEVLSIRASRVERPEYPGFIYIKDAEAELKISERTLARLLKKYNEKTIKKPGKRVDGHSLLRAYIRSQFVENIKAANKSVELISRREAADLLGVPLRVVDYLISRKIVKTLRGGTQKNGRRLRRDDVEAIKKQRKELGKAWSPRPTETYKRAAEFLLRLLAPAPLPFPKVLRAAKTAGFSADNIQRGKRHAGILCSVSPLFGAKPKSWWYLPGQQVPQESAPSADHTSNGETTPVVDPVLKRKRRGRPKGRDPERVQREKDMLAAWERGEFGGNKAAAGRAFNFHRQDATDLINEHLRRKCK